MNPFYRPRILIDVSEETLKRSQRLIPHGLKNQLLSLVIEDTLDLIDEKGIGVISLLLQRRMRMSEVSTSIKDGLNEAGRSQQT